MVTVAESRTLPCEMRPSRVASYTGPPHVQRLSGARPSVFCRRTISSLLVLVYVLTLRHASWAWLHGYPAAATSRSAALKAASTVETGPLHAAVTSDDLGTFLDVLEQIENAQGCYRSARQAVSHAFPSGHGVPKRDFLMRCVESVASDPERRSPSLAALVSGLCPPLDSVRAYAWRAKLQKTAQQEAADVAALRNRALEAALKLWRTMDGAVSGVFKPGRMTTRPMRSAARILECWGISEDDEHAVANAEDLRRMFSQLLEAKEWELVYDLVPRFPKMVADLHYNNALADAKKTSGVTFGRRLLVRNLVEKLYTASNERATITAEIQKGRPLRAVSSCGRSLRLRRYCLEQMLEAGLLDFAEEHGERWWLLVEATEDVVARQQARRAQFLRLSVNVPVTDVDSETQADAVFGQLRAAGTVGLDVELCRGSPALVQLATPDRVFLIDLLALKECPAVGDGLQSLLDDPSVRVLGFGGDDLKFLSKLPCMSAWNSSSRASFVDVQRLVAEQRASDQGTSRKEQLHGLGLSKLVNDTLGQPLDKSMQMSDWSRRPLSDNQRHYAALDAWVLLKLDEQLQNG